MWGQLVYTGLTIVLLINLSETLAQSDSPFPKSYPVLWTKSTEKFTFKETVSHLELKVYNPCNFYETDFFYGIKDYLKIWCENELKVKIFIPLIDMCDNGLGNGNSEEQTYSGNENSSAFERNEQINEIVGISGNVGSTILGLFGKFETKNYDDEIHYLNFKINSLQHRISILPRPAQEFWKNPIELGNRIDLRSQLIQELNSVTSRLWELQNADRLNFFENWKSNGSSKVFSLTSKLISYFKWCDKEIPEISREWKSKKFNKTKFFTIFNMENDIELLTRFESFQPMSCQIDPIGNKAKFVFKFPDTYNEFMDVFTHHSFTLFERIPGTDFVNRAEYVGPKSVISLNQNDCNVPILDNSYALVPMNQNQCEPAKKSSASKYWEKSCVLMPRLDPEQIIQIKSNKTNVIIYCYGFQIEIFYQYSVTERYCPNYVFSLTGGDGFVLKDKDNVTVVTFLGFCKWNSMEKLDMDYVQSQKINSQLMPDLLNLDLKHYTDFLATTRCLESDVKQISEEESSSIWFTLGICALFVILFIIVVKCLQYACCERNQSYR